MISKHWLYGWSYPSLSPDPRLVDFVRARKVQKMPGSDEKQADHSAPNGGVGVEKPPVVHSPAATMDTTDTHRHSEPEQVDMEDEEDTEEPEAVQPITGESVLIILWRNINVIINNELDLNIAFHKGMV